MCYGTPRRSTTRDGRADGGARFELSEGSSLVTAGTRSDLTTGTRGTSSAGVASLWARFFSQLTPLRATAATDRTPAEGAHARVGAHLARPKGARDRRPRSDAPSWSEHVRREDRGRFPSRRGKGEWWDPSREMMRAVRSGVRVAIEVALPCPRGRSNGPAGYFASNVEREHSIALLRDAVVGERLTLEQFIDPREPSPGVGDAGVRGDQGGQILQPSDRGQGSSE